jgi:hypothetical protein
MGDAVEPPQEEVKRRQPEHGEQPEHIVPPSSSSDCSVSAQKNPKFRTL